MADVVLIPCPHCRSNLRIPAAWTEQPMRCKFCRQVFQATRKPGATPLSVQRPANGLASPRPALNPSSPKPAPRSGFPRKTILVGFVVLAGVGLAAVLVVAVLGAVLLKMFTPDSPPPRAKVESEWVAPVKVPPMVPEPKIEPAPSTPPKEIVKAPPDAKPIEKKDKGPSVNPDNPKPPDKSDKPAQPPDKKTKDKDKAAPDKSKDPQVPPALRHILTELALFPPTTGGKSQPIDPASLPQFPANVLDAYKADYKQLMDFAGKDDQFPLRRGHRQNGDGLARKRHCLQDAPDHPRHL